MSSIGMATFHQMNAGDALSALASDPQNGLTEAEVAKRTKEFGPNELKAKHGPSVLRMFLSEFKNTLVLILIAAALVSAFLGEWIDAAAILVIVLLNAMIGFYQEYKADRAIEALKRLLAPVTRVIRDGHEQRMPAVMLVPGDIVILEAGDRVPGDCRLLETATLKIDEAPLTGESVPVEKDALLSLTENVQVADRKNMVFMGTTVVHGRAKALVVSTGMRTEFGRIAKLVQDVQEEQTPLQKRLEVLAKQLGVLFLSISGIVLVAGYLSGVPLLTMFLTAVSLAVAAIPEGLPAVVTITLAIGVQRMAKRHSIIRKLPATETLGSATIICSDKTGTLTKNEMTVRQVVAGGRFYDVSGTGYEPQGSLQAGGVKADLVDNHSLGWLLTASALCNNSALERKADGSWGITGDPTEAALLTLAAKAGWDRGKLEKEWPRSGELPFESERKRMSTLHSVGGEIFALVKGAPELLLDRCTFLLEDGKAVALLEPDRQKIRQYAQNMASDALRVLGFAYRKLPPGFDLTNGTGHKLEDRVESDLVFVGLAGMIDPPREEAKQAIAQAKGAGIRVMMITGDHQATAYAIAKELGLVSATEASVLTGEQVEKMNATDLAEQVQHVGVFARVSPEHKLRIVQAIKASGRHVVAMTGDGVNDAPALKQADIGIAMGITGTDVAKEASDMVLTDDNFASIVAAVEEGRVVFDNIKKSVRYLLSCNVGEVITVLAATLAGFPLLLLPLQILWMNLVTDSLPALALGVDPKEPDVMRRPPRNPKDALVDRLGMLRLSVVGALIAACTLTAFGYVAYTVTGPYDYVMGVARTAAFNTIVMFQLFFVLSARSDTHSFFKLGWKSNKWLLGAVFIGILLELVVIYQSPLEPIFQTVELPLPILGVSVGLALLGFVVPEILKKLWPKTASKQAI